MISITVILVMVAIVMILAAMEYYEKLSYIPLILASLLILWMFYTIVAYILVRLGIPI